jgi:hypothetical protein
MTLLCYVLQGQLNQCVPKEEPGVPCAHCSELDAAHALLAHCAAGRPLCILPLCRADTAHVTHRFHALLLQAMPPCNCRVAEASNMRAAAVAIAPPSVGGREEGDGGASLDTFQACLRLAACWLVQCLREHRLVPVDATLRFVRGTAAQHVCPASRLCDRFISEIQMCCERMHGARLDFDRG